MFGNKKSKKKKSPGIRIHTIGAKEAQRNRDQFNPIRNLTIQRAIRLMEAYARGDYADLMWLFAAPYVGLENSDADYLSIIDRRTGALKEMNWKISRWKPGRDEKPNPEKEDLAARQYEVLVNAYERMENVYEAIEHLALSKFRGFSILEPDDQVAEFIPVDHWNVRREGSRGAWYWNESGQNGVELEKCELFDDNIIVMESPRPIGRIALLKYLRANLSEKEWDYFIEIYGIPSGIVITPDGVNSDNINEFLESAAKARQGGDVAFPSGTEYLPNDAPRGSQPFKPRLEWLSQKLVQAGTGGFLTMLSMSGSGTLAGSAHMEAFRILARSDAREISEAFQRAYDKRKLSEAGLLIPGQRPLAQFEVSAREEQSTDDATDQVVALSRFYMVDPMQIEERTGWKVTARPQPLPALEGVDSNPATHRKKKQLPAPDPEPSVENATLALMEDLEPVRDLIGEALRECGGDLRGAVEMIADGVPELAHKLDSGRLEGVFESQMAEMIVEAFEKEASEGPKKASGGKTA